MIEILIEQSPIGKMQIWNPRYRDMELAEIEAATNFNKEWKPYGYNQCYFCRATATVHITHQPILL